jgi:hypothetical protein
VTCANTPLAEKHGVRYDDVMRIALVLVALGLSACNPTIDFDVPVDGETTIAGGGLLPDLLGAIGFEDFTALDLSSSQEFENNDVRKEQVKAAKLKSATLTIVSGDASFDFLDALSFFVEADGLPEERVASKADVPDGVDTFTLDVDDLDIGPYVRAAAFEITTEVSGNQPSDDTTIRVELLFGVTAEVLGPATTG